MKSLVLLTISLVSYISAGQPVEVVSKQKIAKDTTYLVPTIPFDGTTAELRIVIEAQTFKSKEIQRNANFPMKFDKFKLYLNKKKLNLPNNFIAQLPAIQSPWNSHETFIIPLLNQGIRIQLKLGEQYFWIDLDQEGKIEIPEIKKENKSQ